MALLIFLALLILSSAGFFWAIVYVEVLVDRERT